MNASTLQTLIADRLEVMAAQVELLYAEGNFAEAELLRDEGLAMAEAYDNEELFMYIPDMTNA